MHEPHIQSTMGRKDKQLSPALPQVYLGAGYQHDGSKS